jgi:vanillate monooxygenase ferredoxin subunit
MSAPATDLAVRVARKQTEAQDICSLELVAEGGGALPAFEAGAHVDVVLPAAGGTLIRQYSLCNAPGETHRYLIAVLREPDSRGGSHSVHDTLAEGDLLRISVPRNHFALAPEAPHHLLLAGGIGITPLMAMAEQLSRQGAPFTLHHATRSRARTPFLARIAASAFAPQVIHHHSDGDATQRLDIAATLTQAPAGSHLYVCGPQRFIDAVLATARDQGWPEARLHCEYFSAAAIDTSGDGAFELEVASTGQVITVLPKQTALHALQAAGLDIASSCEEGVCGTCLTGVKSGTPDHRDHYLTTEEQQANDQFLPCCSRARSARLVLAL